MNIYEINNQILDLIDDETGEVVDLDKLQELQLAKDEKIHNVALWIKNITAEKEAIKNEILNLQKRVKSLTAKKERLTEYLGYACEGQSKNYSNCQVQIRNTKAVEVDDNKFIVWAMSHDRDDLLRFKDPSVDKKKIKEALNSGEKIEFAEIVQSQSIKVK